MLCVCVFSYCTCVVQRHVTAWFLSLWNFSLGAVRRDWGGAVCDPCFIIRLVTGYSAWWAVTDTWHSQSLLAARQSRQVVDSSKGGPGWATSPQKTRMLLKRFMKLHIQVWNSGKFAHQRREFIVEGKHLINLFFSRKKVLSLLKDDDDDHQCWSVCGIYNYQMTHFIIIITSKLICSNS